MSVESRIGWGVFFLVLVVLIMKYAIPALQNHGIKREQRKYRIPPGRERLHAYGALYDESAQWCLFIGWPIKMAPKVLKRGWGITDTQSAREALVWLRDEGHRTDYSPYAQAAIYAAMTEMGQMRPNEQNAALEYLHSFYAQIRSAPEIVHSVSLIRQNLWTTWSNQLPLPVFDSLKDVDAWDIERIGHVVRMAFRAGYLSEDEAYGWLSVADQMARVRYHSWQQYCAAWLLGRIFWGARGGKELSQDSLARVGWALKPGKDGYELWRKFPLS